MVEALWQSLEKSSHSSSSSTGSINTETSRRQHAKLTIELVNSCLNEIQERLRVPVSLRVDGYRTQFQVKDPLTLLMTREAFGSWAANRVFVEVAGRDIFRTFARFSWVDGIICADEAVWMHNLSDFYEPAPDMINGDKRSAEFLSRLEATRPYIATLLNDYDDKKLLPAGFRASLERTLLSKR